MTNLNLTTNFLSFHQDAQKLLIKALWESGYNLKSLVEAKKIVAPKNSLVGTWYIQTIKNMGFYLNVSKKDLEDI